LAIAKTKSQQLSDLKLSDNPLILVAETPEKPGNIGALLRTADAAHLDAVIIANPNDLTNIVRSSVEFVLQTKLRLERQQKLSLKKEKSISTVPHCKIPQRIIRKITPRPPH
jgi:TrmH family RNA methyltransferase